LHCPDRWRIWHGKEVSHEFIHRRSPRIRQPFIAVIALRSGEHLEAMLFGYERGAFTGAHARIRASSNSAKAAPCCWMKYRDALGLQAKLLRVLQEREVERLGGRTPLHSMSESWRRPTPPA